MTDLETLTDHIRVKTPVLFLIFNRPATTQQVFEAIRQAKPERLYVAADGPRPDRPDEGARCAEVRRIATSVDWPCEVKTLFRETNLGCKMGVSGGINWFFQHEEEGIILEDDCLPHPTFFRFCEELLAHYRHDQRVAMISGDNFQFGHRINDDSYYFSNNNHIWGWATWRSRWQHDYDVDMKLWPKARDEGRVADWAQTKAEHRYFTEIFQAVFDGTIDTWDYQWGFGSRCNGRISVMPNVNLVSNIGFGIEATHTKNLSSLACQSMSEMQFPLKHPTFVSASSELDYRYFNNFLKKSVFCESTHKIAKLFR